MSNLVLGDAGVILALSSAAAGILTLAAGLALRDESFARLGRFLVWGVLAGAALAFAAMERALITRDFSVEYVAANGSSRTSGLFNFATAWAALEGSILLWGLVLAGYLAVMSWLFGRRGGASHPDGRLTSWALICGLAAAVFFFALMVGPADPFRAFDPAPGYDGPGPNPLLQDNPLMVIHPPMLYMGYVGFTVPFAFGMASLITGRVDEAWLAKTRRWSLVSWGFLTAGIVLGAWWSYDTLGWGGYWAWDPVENASLLPWLTATAYLHSSLIQERRGLLRVWNLSLVSATFCLTILGTFITRSGILDSVHSFTTSGIGPWLLGFFGFTTIASVALIGMRGDRLRSAERVDSFLSREGSFLINNLLFALFALVVLLGTVFPLVVEAVGGERLSVGSPYFSRMTMPVGLALLFMMAAAPALNWRKTSADLASRRLLKPAAAGVGALALALALGARGMAPLLAFTLGGFAAGTAVRRLYLAVRRLGMKGLTGVSGGGMITHLGVVIVAVALAASSSYLQQKELSLDEGETQSFAGHELTFLGTEEVAHAEREEVRARVAVNGECCATPGVSRYTLRGQAVGHPVTLNSVLNDVQLAVIRLPSQTGETLVLRVVRQPLVVWLWVGGGVMLLGLLAAAVRGGGRRSRSESPAAERTDAPTDAGDAGDGDTETSAADHQTISPEQTTATRTTSAQA